LAAVHSLTPSPPATFTVSPTESPIPSETPTATPTPTVTPTVTPSPSPSATPCAEAAGRVVTGTFPSPIQGIEQRYRVYLPPCYGGSDRLYPALYLFHGMPYTESHWDDLGIDEAADAGISGGTLPPFIIVLPFGGQIADTTSGGDWSFEGVFLNEVIPAMQERYCVWAEPAGRAIGGLSRGGYWSLEIGFRHPEFFAAVGGHSAAIFPDNAGPAYNPLSTGADPSLAGLPIYLDIGETDYLRQGVFDLHDVMVAAGAPHVWLVNPGGHTDAYWSEHAAEYLAWYASHWPADPSDYPPAGGRTCPP
jgi:enterochelin esterase-like enzyme